MKPETAVQLLQLNQTFYQTFAGSFAQSRHEPQPGFARLLPYLPGNGRLLDVGCGNGRFGAFTAGHWQEYVGVDFSGGLLELAQAVPGGTFHQRNLGQAGCLDGLGQFESVACLAVLQHIPGFANRLRLLQEMKARLAVNGRLLLSTWQFAQNGRQARKITDWAQAGINPADLEPGDHLLTWQRGGEGLRYVCLIDEAATATLAQAAGLTILDQFHSDGKEGTLSLYTIMTTNN